MRLERGFELEEPRFEIVWGTQANVVESELKRHETTTSSQFHVRCLGGLDCWMRLLPEDGQSGRLSAIRLGVRGQDLRSYDTLLVALERAFGPGRVSSQPTQIYPPRLTEWRVPGAELRLECPETKNSFGQYAVVVIREAKND